MRWFVGKILSLPIWALVFVIGALRFVVPPLLKAVRALFAAYQGMWKWRDEIMTLYRQGRHLQADVRRLGEEQRASNAFHPNKKTVFLLITCGQAVRNFLLSDVLPGLRARFNVVILAPYGHSAEVRARYTQPGVHVLPWFDNFRSAIERFFLYYLMRQSGSGTHKNWLANLEKRAKQTKRWRYGKHLFLHRASKLLGAVIGVRGMHALYHGFYLGLLPRSLFKQLLTTYKPALIISTTAHHAEAWPLTYFGRRLGCKTLANILSWDNPTTKPAMDTSCDYYTVWSEEMKQELARHFSYIKTKPFVTGAPLFDIYYNRPGAMDRTSFLTSLGLSPDLPYILWATNTPSAMPDESEIIIRYWGELNRTPLAGKVGLLVRLHPKEERSLYAALEGQPNVALTVAGPQHWESSDRWLPTDGDMRLLLNSMLHAAATVNVASTMTLESFALAVPTINVAFKSRDDREDQGLMWSFDMYHTSDHYRAIVDNDAVALARSMDDLVEHTIDAIENGTRRKAAMQKTLAQKAAYCDGTSAQRFVEVVTSILEPEKIPQQVRAAIPRGHEPADMSPVPHATPAE
jgi:hypothetical protein